MQVRTALAVRMRRLARWEVLVPAAVLYVLSTVLFFASALPFAIPVVTQACGQSPPDVRFYTAGDDVRTFLSGCGAAGHAAYRNLQIADLFYPAISGIFLAAALAVTLCGLVAPTSWLPALAAVPLVGSLFDYLENLAAWTVLAADPAGPAADLLGLASVGKQLFSWAAWLLLMAAVVVTVVRRSQRRLRPPALTAPGTAR